MTQMVPGENVQVATTLKSFIKVFIIFILNTFYISEALNKLQIGVAPAQMLKFLRY